MPSLLDLYVFQDAINWINVPDCFIYSIEYVTSTNVENVSNIQSFTRHRPRPTFGSLQGLLKFIDCEFDNIKDCNGIGIEELAMSPNATIAGLSSLFLNIASLSADLCDEDTLIHQDYIAHSDCLKEFFTSANGMECFKESRELARGFYDSLSFSEDDVVSKQFISCV
ncbi:uncharacterized protein TNCV_3598281 [Trichonephila clavipes]|nr:uncharacterized protein TNCV_3598281 [Trichonephila clavipes]